MPRAIAANRRYPAALPLAAALLLAACGSLGGDGGGADNLPNRGVVPYTLLLEGSGEDATRAFVLAGDRAAGRTIDNPSAVVWDDTVLLALDVTVGGKTHLERAVSLDGSGFSDAEPLLQASALPAEVFGAVDSVRAPSLCVHQGGLLLAFEVGSGGGIGLVPLDAAGQLVGTPTWAVKPANDLPLWRAASPSLVSDGRDLLLYYQGGAEPQGVKLAQRDEAGDWTLAGTVLPAQTSGCANDQGFAAPCWDAKGTLDPEVRVATTGAGERVYRMFYASGNPGARQLGFAASYDGIRWERFAYNPVLVDDGGDLASPTNVLLGSVYWLYAGGGTFAARGVVAARNDRPQASEHF